LGQIICLEKSILKKRRKLPASIDENISKETEKKSQIKLKLKRKFFFELNSFLEEQMLTFSPLLLLLLLLLHTTTT